jgi:hypothetical protein
MNFHQIKMSVANINVIGVIGYQNFKHFGEKSYL